MNLCCKNCRCVLFTDADLMMHDLEPKHEFDHHKSSKQHDSSTIIVRDNLSSPDATTAATTAVTADDKKSASDDASAVSASSSSVETKSENIFATSSMVGSMMYKSTGSNCSSFFLKDALDWMKAFDTQGKLFCPKCGTRVGSYMWSGSQCSCGAWVVPALQIPKSKVDARKVVAAENQ